MLMYSCYYTMTCIIGQSRQTTQQAQCWSWGNKRETFSERKSTSRSWDGSTQGSRGATSSSWQGLKDGQRSEREREEKVTMPHTMSSFSFILYCIIIMVLILSSECLHCLSYYRSNCTLYGFVYSSALHLKALWTCRCTTFRLNNTICYLGLFLAATRASAYRSVYPDLGMFLKPHNLRNNELSRVSNTLGTTLLQLSVRWLTVVKNALFAFVYDLYLFWCVYL